jgi:hypothetical protein
VQEHSFSARVDFHMRENWSAYVRVFHDQGESNQFEGVSGRKIRITANPSNAVFNLQGVMGSGLLNEFKFGYNAAPTTIVGEAPFVNGIDFGLLAINLTGSIANTGIAGQGSSTGVTIPGGLVRANSATNGHASPRHLSPIHRERLELLLADVDPLARRAEIDCVGLRHDGDRLGNASRLQREIDREVLCRNESHARVFEGGELAERRLQRVHRSRKAGDHIATCGVRHRRPDFTRALVGCRDGGAHDHSTGLIDYCPGELSPRLGQQRQRQRQYQRERHQQACLAALLPIPHCVRSSTAWKSVGGDTRGVVPPPSRCTFVG